MSELGESLPPPLVTREGSTIAPPFARLEERVASLVERHREARKTIEELEARLREQEQRLAQLSQQAADQDRLRRELRQRIARLISQVAVLEKAESKEIPAKEATS